jgi:GMP synthase (glutamine-hydrolysing)
MKKILIIQSRRRPEMLKAEQGEYERAVANAAVLSFLSSVDESVAWDNPATVLAGYDAVMLGGSGEFDFDGGRAADDEARVTSQQIAKRLTPLVRYAYEQSFPVLGICFGHQIVSEVFDVKAVNDHDQKKVGTFLVTLSEAGKRDLLFGALPETFMAQYGHKDSLSLVPAEAVVLAGNERCKTSALRYGRSLYTVQFHPELTKSDIAFKLANTPGYLPEGVLVESIVQDSVDASRIIPLFIERVVEEIRL